jgi:hypothetical protein
VITVFGPPFYDPDEWEPDEAAVEQLPLEWVREWEHRLTQSSSFFMPAPPGGELHGHRIIVEDGTSYMNQGGEWVPDGG